MHKGLINKSWFLHVTNLSELILVVYYKYPLKLLIRISLGQHKHSHQRYSNSGSLVHQLMTGHHLRNFDSHIWFDHNNCILQEVDLMKFFLWHRYSRLWEVTGDKYGLTCPGSVPNENGTVTCRNLTVPDCVDRTVYCSLPPDSTADTSVTVVNNPSSHYKKSPGELPTAFYWVYGSYPKLMDQKVETTRDYSTANFKISRNPNPIGQGLGIDRVKRASLIVTGSKYLTSGY